MRIIAAFLILISISIVANSTQFKWVENNPPPEITFDPDYFILLGPKEELIVKVNMTTGKHTFGENYNLSEAAKAFWSFVTKRINVYQRCVE